GPLRCTVTRWPGPALGYQLIRKSTSRAMRRRSVRVRPAPRFSPVGGVGQHAAASRRRSPVRTRYGVRAPLAGTTRPRPAARWPTWWNADTPDPKPGAARRGGASPPVGTTPPAPAGPRPLYRRV